MRVTFRIYIWSGKDLSEKSKGIVREFRKWHPWQPPGGYQMFINESIGTPVDHLGLASLTLLPVSLDSKPTNMSDRYTSLAVVCLMCHATPNKPPGTNVTICNVLFSVANRPGS